MEYGHHEVAQLPDDAGWIHVYGKGSMHAGKPVPGLPVYTTAEEAVAALRDHALRPGEERSQDTSVARYLLDAEPGMFDPYLNKRLRDTYPRKDYMQGILGPREHSDFARETVGRNPMMAAPLALAIPGYTAAKAVGLMPQARSPASLDEIFAAYEGLFSGLKDNVKSKRKPKEDE